MDPSFSAVPIVIPAYKPGQPLVALVDALLELGVPAIIVVDDGSGPEFQKYFQRIAAAADVRVVHHAVNLGKGAALKTGMNFALVHFPECCGVVTADADGQHHPEDIRRIADRLRAKPDSLVMGVRAFDRAVPWRSRAGNQVTCALMHLMVGQKLSDTQTGLRGIPRKLIPHLLHVPSSGYEFELDMLMACKYQSCSVLEEPIRTIYLDGNLSSHFHPLFDSMRIYVVLFRFSILSLLTAVLDNVVFVLVFGATGSIGQSQIGGRFWAMIFNYLGARRAVFHSQQRHSMVFPKYMFLVVCNGLLSYGLIQMLYSRLGFPAIPAKLLVEGVLFIANFALQRDFVFTQRHSAATATDWDRYYTNVPATAALTRKYTASVLVDVIRRYATPAKDSRLSIVEIGGANSCFLDRILLAIGPRTYDVIDTNEYGLSLLARRVGNGQVVRLHQESVLALSLGRDADLVFSVGLVEHFDPGETRKAVLAHFDALRPGGLAIITFPTPTLLYRIARRLIEMGGMWKFPDERPLDRAEVLAAVRERGDVVYQKTLWPLILTQHVIAAQKRVAHAEPLRSEVRPELP
jgi:glycosyltransferase involved in cell wall biosynthesis